MDDRTLALLGDRASQERITERGELLPCRCGKSNPQVVVYNKISKFQREQGLKPSYVVCLSCGSQTSTHGNEKEAIREWNTRAPILMPEQIKRLEETE